MGNTADSAPEADRVIARLRDDILDGVREPGSRLVERELAEELGTSRVPVRDALKALAAEGLVTLRPRTWAVVREFTAGDESDFGEVREALEALAFRLAAQRRTEEGLALLRGDVDAELAAARAGDGVRARRAAADFHERVIELSGNAMLIEIGQLTGSRMRWFMSQHDDLDAMARQHEGLWEAIAQQDLAQLELRVAEHLRSSVEHLRAHAAAERGEPGA
ncbi:transcriptional regulator [Brachybacterium phenoliresistens]|uniref:Transcriptional regulator n=1 Tax=Brachybacterium phenoliresistens TaxID=396014 RepID=Z9JXN9_9MICO|nr:GntR family transcriptional regulator [Brachybacterium phenoliresistens]EWS82561.1 transcriptional regulator [Brachybacterium phenoliresistens]